MAEGPHLQIDIGNLAGAPDEESDELRRKGEGYIGLHFDNLYDQDEDESGEKVDTATGVPYDNSTYTGTEELSGVDEHDGSDVLPDIDDEEDVAAKWLRQHERHPHSLQSMLGQVGLFEVFPGREPELPTTGEPRITRQMLD